MWWASSFYLSQLKTVRLGGFKKVILWGFPSRVWGVGQGSLRGAQEGAHRVSGVGDTGTLTHAPGWMGPAASEVYALHSGDVGWGPFHHSSCPTREMPHRVRYGQGKNLKVQDVKG